MNSSYQPMLTWKRLSLQILLLLNCITGNCGEKWILVESDKTAAIFIDNTSISTSNSVTQFRSATNFHKQITPTLSTITRYEFKCASQTYRFIGLATYSEYFGRGQTIGFLTPSEIGLDSQKFYPIEGTASAFQKFVCNR